MPECLSACAAGFYEEMKHTKLCLAEITAERMILWHFLIQQSEYYRHLLSHLAQDLESGAL